jgi:hypothetical protein
MLATLMRVYVYASSIALLHWMGDKQLRRQDNRRTIVSLQTSVEARNVADQDVRNPSRGGGSTSPFGCATMLPSVFAVSQTIAAHLSSARKCTRSQQEWSARCR